MLRATSILYHISIDPSSMSESISAEQYEPVAKPKPNWACTMEKMAYMLLITNKAEAAEGAEASMQEPSRDGKIGRIRKELQEAMKAKFQSVVVAAHRRVCQETVKETM